MTKDITNLAVGATKNRVNAILAVKLTMIVDYLTGVITTAGKKSCH